MSARLHRNPAVLWRRTPRAVLVLVPGHNEVTVLEGTAVALWDAFDEAATVDEVIDSVTGRVSTHRAVVTADVRRVVGRLRDRGVLEP